jgi:hypothetical protein
LRIRNLLALAEREWNDATGGYLGGDTLAAL